MSLKFSIKKWIFYIYLRIKKVGKSYDEDAKKFDPNWPGPDNLFGYTGLGYDYTSSLTYARARYYQPEIGRFISEDTYKGTLGNPQSQNGYAYVNNNPLIYTDPSGYILKQFWQGIKNFLFGDDDPRDNEETREFFDQYVWDKTRETPK